MDDKRGATRDNDLQDLVKVMAAALARNVGIPEGADWGELVDRHMQSQIFESYREAIAEREPSDVLAWMLERLAAIEARVLTLQAAALAPKAAADEAQLAQGFNTQAFLPAAATILCDHELVQTGFYPVEYSQDGTPFRWIGPSPQAKVVLPKTCLPVEIQMTISHVYVTDIIDRVKVSLAGGEFVPVAVERQPNGTVLTARPVAGPLQGARSLEFDIDVIRTESPKLRGKTDGREISVALSRIEMISLR